MRPDAVALATTAARVDLLVRLAVWAAVVAVAFLVGLVVGLELARPAPTEDELVEHLRADGWRWAAGDDEPCPDGAP